MAVKQNKQLIFMLLRYFLLLFLAFILLLSPLFYDVFLKLTIYPVNFFLNFCYTSAVSGDTIFVEGIQITLIPACIAVSAYFLLLILNLTTPIKIKTRIKLLLLSFVMLLLVNIIRILILSILLIDNSAYFDIVHKFFWYFMSTIFVLIIWFSLIAIFKIRQIPVYSDFKALIKSIKQ